MAAPAPQPPTDSTASFGVVVLGAGASAHTALEALRNEGYPGTVAMIAARGERPDDEGRDDAWYTEHGVVRFREAHVAALHPAGHTCTLSDGRLIGWSHLIVAPSAAPSSAGLEPASGWDAVVPVGSVAEARAWLSTHGAVTHALVVGGTLAGLELAAALRGRAVVVTLVDESLGAPLDARFGAELGAALRNLHQRQGVRFVSGAVQDVSPGLLRLDDGRALAADVVFNTRPRVAPLEVVAEAGIAVERGVLVDERLRTSVPDVSALGECARWPDPHTGARISVDHWAAAQRQAEVIARRLVGRDDHFDAAPFFRSRQYDVSLTFLGHAESWDSVEVQGDLTRFDATVTWRQGERLVAVVTIAREMGLRRAPWRRSGSHGAPGLE